MKNLYKELNLEKNASADEIRKAYKKHALFCHPDKGGSDEKMQALNQAYQTLINPLKRQAFDLEWEAFQSLDEDTPIVNPANVAYLDQTQSTPFSEGFKQQHAAWLAEFTLKPQKTSKVATHFKPLQDVLEKSHDMSEFLATIEDCLHQPLSPQLAISLLLHRLHEQTTPEQTQCFIERCLKASANPYQPRETDLYQGIAALLRAIETKDPSQSVLTSFEKITNYAFGASPMPRFVSVLLQDHAFRFYFKKSLEKRWLRPRPLLLARFNGKKSLNTLVNQLKQNGSAQKSLLMLLKLLRQFEKGLPETAEKSAATYREQGFFLLDWIPIFSQHTNFSVVLNTLLQAGVYFQFAASCETDKSHQMADEALAQRLYLLTYSMAQRATPDITLYIGTHVLKHLALFHYVDDALPNIIAGIQHRVFQLADIFPIYRSIQSNVDLLFHSDEKALHGMRDYLHALMEIVEYNQLSDEPLSIDHRPVTILYQAYEASLKNWYTDEHDPAQENRLRLNLMCELLEEKGWSFDDVTQQVDFSWQVKRDEDGWLSPKETLHFGDTKASEIFKSIEGFKVDYQTGYIEFVTAPWDAKTDQTCDRLITLSDLQEMLTKGIDGAFFSLDPVDPDLPYHPFNAMRFAPSQLYETEFLKSMLLADYLLKFLTMKHEVQGQFPFATRPIDALLSHIPDVAVRFIHHYQPAAEQESLHRFWIEAREMPTAIYDFANDEDDLHCFAFPEIQMVVKKHLMVHDSHGNLVDADEANEGWFFYDLNDAQREEVRQGKRKLDTPAILFNGKSPRLYFYEEDCLSDAFDFDDRYEQLRRVDKAEKDVHRKIIRNEDNEAFLFFMTNLVTEQSHRSNHFTPEYIFAQEFTDRYDLLSAYFPELGRLRELSRITVLIRFLKNIREHNSTTIDTLETLYKNTHHWKKREKEINKEVHRLNDAYQKEFRAHYQAVENQLSSQFAEWRRIYHLASYTQQHQVIDKVTSFFQEAHVDRCKIERMLRHEFGADGWVVDGVTQHALQAYKSQLDKALIELKAIIPAEKALLEKKLKGRVSLENQFKAIGLKAEEKPVDLNKKCLWVPANIQHRFYKNGEAKHAQTTYGGVYVQPQVKLLQQNSNLYHAALQSVFQNNQTRRVTSQQVANNTGQNSFNRKEITRGFQDHHIISNKNPRMQTHKLLEKSNFNIESRKNKIFLPTKAENHPSRSIHIGRHTNRAIEHVARKMDRALSRGRKENWTTEKYDQAITRILKEERVELKAGNIALNKRKRPWANQ